MATVNFNFTAVGDGDSIQLIAGDKFNYSVSGTFVGTVVIQQSTDGGQSWKQVGDPISAAQSSVLTVSYGGSNVGIYRFQCIAFTSGTIVTSLADEDIVLFDVKNNRLEQVFKVTEAGIEFTGTILQNDAPLVSGAATDLSNITGVDFGAPISTTGSHSFISGDGASSTVEFGENVAGLGSQPGIAASGTFYIGTGGALTLNNLAGNLTVNPTAGILNLWGGTGTSIQGGSGNITLSSAANNVAFSSTTGNVDFTGVGGVVDFTGVTVNGLPAGGDAWSDLVDSNIIPDINNTRDLGSPTKLFSDLYATNLKDASNVISVLITQRLLNDSAGSIALNYNSTTALTPYKNIIPNGANSIDLGSATLYWRNLYVSDLRDGSGNIVMRSLNRALHDPAGSVIFDFNSSVQMVAHKKIRPNADATIDLGNAGQNWLKVHSRSVESNAGLVVKATAGNDVAFQGDGADFTALTSANFTGVAVSGLSAGNSSVEAKSSSLTAWPFAVSTWGDLNSISLPDGDYLITAQLEMYGAVGSAPAKALVDLGVSTTAGNSATGLAMGDNRLKASLEAPGGTGVDTNVGLTIASYKVTVSGGPTTFYLKGRMQSTTTNWQYAGYKISAIPLAVSY